MTVRNSILSLILMGLVGYLVILPRMTVSKSDFNPEVSFELVKHGALLIDARSPEEYNSRHIKGAINIPHLEIQKNADLFEKLTKSDKTKAIVVYCASGRRSGIAKKNLEKLGYTNVTNHGGIGSWKQGE